MLLEVIYYTGRGRIRNSNEDSLLVAGRIYNMYDMNKPEMAEFSRGIFAVADGMGGYAGGAAASGIVVSSLAESGSNIEEALKRAGELMERAGRKDLELSNMGSVVSGLSIDKRRAEIFNIGDSRTYIMREELELITEDDSLVWELLKDKSVEREEFYEMVRTHPEKNIVTSAVMGRNPEVRVRRYLEDIRAGDKYLICSDGLWEEMPHKILEKCMGEEGREAGEMLLSEAEREGRDNISFIVVEIKSI